MSDERAPGWMMAEVAEGLQRLVVLRLDGCPPADAIDGVALAWVDALLVRGVDWQEHLDACRLRDAFRRLAAHVTRWPPPAALWQYMPRRLEPRRLPPPPMSDERRARMREMVAAIRAKLVRS